MWGDRKNTKKRKFFFKNNWCVHNTHHGRWLGDGNGVTRFEIKRIILRTNRTYFSKRGQAGVTSESRIFCVFLQQAAEYQARPSHWWQLSQSRGRVSWLTTYVYVCICVYIYVCVCASVTTSRKRIKNIHCLRNFTNCRHITMQYHQSHTYLTSILRCTNHKKQSYAKNHTLWFCTKKTEPLRVCAVYFVLVCVCAYTRMPAIFLSVEFITNDALNCYCYSTCAMVPLYEVLRIGRRLR